MNNDLANLDEILYGNLRPWLDSNKPDEKFHSMIYELPIVHPNYQNLFEIAFHRPFNNKTQYYHKYILNESISYCNKLYELYNEDSNLKLQKYWFDNTSKKLQTRLKELGKLIKEKQFDISFIDPTKTSFEIDTEHKTDTYIIQLLKIALIRIYLEMQEIFKSIEEESAFIESDFYSRFLNESVPGKSFLKEVQTITIANEEKEIYKTNKANDKIELKAFHSFRYKEYDTEIDKLTDLCDSLKKNGFISKDTSLANFKKVFSGNEITTPVIWTGNPSELYYFIHLIYTVHQLVEDMKQQQWKIACHCFTKLDGSIFDRSKLKQLKEPKSTMHLLEQAVDLIK